jgi:predicted chitinase
MPTFFQTWNLPGSSRFQYICFDASSRQAAELIAEKWLTHKSKKYQMSASEIANGYQGSLVSKTEAKKWKYQSGAAILDIETGRDNYDYYTKEVAE